MPFPKDPNLKGLAAVIYHSEVPPWEFDIRAVPPGTEPLEVSDWHRRHGRANATVPNMDRIAQARVAPVPKRPSDER